MNNITVLIVEDQRLVAEHIRATLEKKNMIVAGIFDHGEDALEFLKMNRPDIILMDIELKGALDGISTAKMVHDLYPTPVIYLTEYKDDKTLDRAKKTLPANYLTKPFQEPDLLRAIELAFYTSTATNPTVKTVLERDVFLRTENQHFIKLPLREILYLKADRAYCKLITRNKEYIITNSMNHVHEQINHPDFVKVHRSYVININQITAIEGRTVKIGVDVIQMNDEAFAGLMTSIKVIK